MERIFSKSVDRQLDPTVFTTILRSAIYRREILEHGLPVTERRIACVSLVVQLINNFIRMFKIRCLRCPKRNKINNYFQVTFPRLAVLVLHTEKNIKGKICQKQREKEKKSLRHVAMVAKFPDLNNPWSCKYDRKKGRTEFPVHDCTKEQSGNPYV